MNFKQGTNKNQEYLFVKKPEDFLPEEHLAKAIYEVVEHLDLSKIESKYSDIGQNAYNPKMMTRLIFNGYSVGAKYGKDKRGDELPEHLRSKESRKKAIEEAVKKLKEQKEIMKGKIKKEKKRDPTQTELKKIEETKINVTDHDAKFMKERSGVIKPNYNPQISVDEEKQFILANDVTNECNDQHQLVPMLEKTKENIGKDPDKVKVDNGYYPQLEKARKLFPEIDLYVDDPKRREEDLDMDKVKEEYTEVQYDNLKKLLTDEGYKEYKKRMHTVEPLTCPEKTGHIP